MLVNMILATLMLMTAGPAVHDATPPSQANVALVPVAQAQDLLHGFRAASIEHEGRIWNYRLLPPARVEPGKSYPLLFFLHGAGERGDDNAAQLAHLPDKMALAEYREAFDGYVLAPQCRTGERWSATPWSGATALPLSPKATLDMRAALATLARTLAEEPIDLERVHVTGLSMGGFGTWDLAARYPERWASAVPVCGGGDPGQSHKMLDLAIWAWHGGADSVVIPERTRMMVHALWQLGSGAKYSEVVGVGHDSWHTAYDIQQGLWDWLALQVRGAAKSPAWQDIEVDPDGLPRTELGELSHVSGIRFGADLEGQHEVVGQGLHIAHDARIVYEKAVAGGNQWVRGRLELQGDVVLRNDNPWQHYGRMLRFDAPLVSYGKVTIEGAGLGGVELPAECYGSLRGPIFVESGRLVVSYDWCLGDWEQPTVLRGGNVLLGNVACLEPFVVERDSGFSTSGRNVLKGTLFVKAGARCTFDTGGGNITVLEGQLLGDGDLTWVGGARPATVGAASRLAGELPSLLKGTLHLTQGTLALAKPDGVHAVAGPLVLGGGQAPAALRWEGSNQVGEDSVIRVMGDHGGRLELDGHSEVLGPISALGDLTVALDRERSADENHGPGNAGHFRFQLGNSWAPKKQMLFEGWLPAEVGGHVLTLLGPDGQPLAVAPDSLAAMGFRDPGGREPGLYRAGLGKGGTLVPGARVSPGGAAAAAWAPDALAAGRALWDRPGRSQLAKEGSFLPRDAVISFFGDSITWQDHYLARIGSALLKDKDTAGGFCQLYNRGINGGGVRELIAGSPQSARRGTDGNSPQKTYQQVLADDGTTISVVFIGINDVTWRGTTEADFEQDLRSLAAYTQAAEAGLVLCTPFLAGELPGGGNKHDARIERFSKICATVAKDTQAVFVDLRGAALAWLWEHNARLRLDGSLEHDTKGWLTYDGIHPTERGNELIADLIADGLLRSAARAR